MVDAEVARAHRRTPSTPRHSSRVGLLEHKRCAHALRLASPATLGGDVVFDWRRHALHGCLRPDRREGSSRSCSPSPAGRAHGHAQVAWARGGRRRSDAHDRRRTPAPRLPSDTRCPGEVQGRCSARGKGSLSGLFEFRPVVCKATELGWIRSGLYLQHHSPPRADPHDGRAGRRGPREARAEAPGGEDERVGRG